MRYTLHGHTCPCCLDAEAFVATNWPDPPPQYCRCQRCGAAVRHVEEPEADALVRRNLARR